MITQTRFFRDTWVEIDLDNLYKNVHNIKQHLPEGVTMFAVVKANAYGHGDVQTAHTALNGGAGGLAVAFLDEAISLRENGIEAPILVLGATRAEDAYLAMSHDISLTVFDYAWLESAREYLEKEDGKLNLHIKCDTGMGRIGVRNSADLQKVEKFIRQESKFQLEGVFTHFATADELDTEYFERQLEVFERMLSSLTERPKYIHSSNSAATLSHPKSHFNAVRAGIAMYGLSPSVEMKAVLPFPLEQVFSLHSRIVQVKELRAGEKVSYGATYETKKNEWIGTLPIGYADGWLRKLQGQEVLVDGKRAPIVGRICMDQCMISLPEEVQPGTKVTLIGRQDGDFISMDEIAAKLDTINYEIPCIISNRVPRIYIKDGEPVEVSNQLLATSGFYKK
ncbi:alanine racemase [Bacillus sp. SG-1]|uniref:alanine racemase n=1 Tax=Bacillus sp. SG-1 TaxID=161544 RepID=UPI0001544B22|nr:alanine racemase [Bacillus sp. SG-1]EDL63255.1 alanine racemase [Bacillus sp. SG-1]